MKKLDSEIRHTEVTQGVNFKNANYSTILFFLGPSKSVHNSRETGKAGPTSSAIWLGYIDPSVCMAFWGGRLHRWPLGIVYFTLGRMILQTSLVTWLMV